MLRRDRAGRWRDERGHFASPPSVVGVADALADAIDSSWVGYELESGDSESGPRATKGKRPQGQAVRSYGAEGDDVTPDALSRGLRRFRRLSGAGETRRSTRVQVVARLDESIKARHASDGTRWASLSFAESGAVALDHAAGEAEGLGVAYRGVRIVGIEIRTFGPEALAPAESAKKGKRQWKKPKSKRLSTVASRSKRTSGRNVPKSSRGSKSVARTPTKRASTSRKKMPAPSATRSRKRSGKKRSR